MVGAGASGSVLAARLSEDSARRVILLEAGDAPASLDAFPPGLLNAGTVEAAMPGHPQNWSYPAKLMADRDYSLARGRILGGSMTINGGYFVRARREDFDRWSAGGNTAWEWDRALEFYRQLETDLDCGDTVTHGGSGPMLVRRPPQNDAVTMAFFGAALSLGFAREVDKNDQGAPGIGAVPMDVVDGVRGNPGTAYVLPALHRDNLEVRGGSRVLRVVFDGSRAIGVEVLAGGETTVVHAPEIVLCAGSIATPHLLLLSGVGDREALSSLGIEVIAHHPGVGAHFSDHPQITVQWKARPGVIDLGLPRTMASVLAATSPDSEVPGDLEILPMLKPTTALMNLPAAVDDVLDVFVALQAPASRGRIRLASADPFTPPLIEHNYLVEETDRRRMRYAVRLAARLLDTDEFVAVSAGRVGLDDEVLANDDALDAWIAASIGTSLHGCGSAAFGTMDAVVDQHGSVLGVDGLRVADTSILPTVPLRGPAATAVLIGELVAAQMRREHRE